jgi:hypothetical protein
MHIQCHKALSRAYNLRRIQEETDYLTINKGSGDPNKNNGVTSQEVFF